VRINGYDESTIEMSDSVLRGLTVHGREDSRLNITNTSMVGLYAEGNTRIHARGCEVNNTLNVVISSSNVTIHDLHPGHVRYWNPEENHTIIFDTEDWRPTIVIENSDITGFGLHFSKTANATIYDSDLRRVISAGQTQLWISNSTTYYSMTAYHESRVQAMDCSFGSSSARHNSTVIVTNATFKNHWVYDQANKIDYWYLDLAVIDPANQTIPGATITVAHPNQTIIATGNTAASGRATFTLLSGTTNATGFYPVGNYTVTANHQTYEATTEIEMDGNQRLDMIIPMPIPEATTWTISLFWTLLLPIQKRYRHRSNRR
jgi:hypothetical protein